MSRIRWFDMMAVALAIAVLAGLGFATRSHSSPAGAPGTAALDRPHPPADTHPSVLFIGDSYTAGGADRDNSYGCMAAIKLGWLCNLSAGPGTGYISGGPANRFTIDDDIGPSKSFEERLPELAAKYDPAIVVLDGGRNDLFASRDAVFRAMVATIGGVRRTWPKATIVLIRPRFLAHPDDDLNFDDGFMARLRAANAANGILVIDPINELADTDTSDLLSDDGIHPNRRGELTLSSVLLEALAENRTALGT